MREGAAADKRLISAKRKVGKLGDIACHLREMFKLFLADGGVAKLKLQIGENGAQVCVATALAVSIDTALHMSRSGLHGSERVRYGYVGIVVTVYADDAVKTAAHVSNDFGYRLRQAAPLVSHRQRTSAPAFLAAS